MCVVIACVIRTESHHIKLRNRLIDRLATHGFKMLKETILARREFFLRFISVLNILGSSRRVRFLYTTTSLKLVAFLSSRGIG